MGITNCSDQLCCDISFAVYEVDVLLVDRIKEHSVDREVSTESIFFGIGEADTVWASSVTIRSICAECCYLDISPSFRSDYSDDAKGLSDRNRALVTKDRANLIRCGIGGYIIVLG